MNGATHRHGSHTNAINGNLAKMEGIMSSANTSLPQFSGVAGNEHRFPKLVSNLNWDVNIADLHFHIRAFQTNSTVLRCIFYN
jgi:hypothetical protein